MKKLCGRTRGDPDSCPHSFFYFQKPYVERLEREARVMLLFPLHVLCDRVVHDLFVGDEG
jgi:hypothetical protein